MTLYHKITGQGPDLVLIHGWGFHSGVWQFLEKRWCQNYRLHLIDLPGFGQSAEIIPASTLDGLLMQILPFLPSQAIYVGWSLGGLITLALALHEPEKMRTLVTIGATPCFMEKSNWLGVSDSVFNTFYNAIADDVVKGLQKFISLALFERQQQKKHYSFLFDLICSQGKPNKASLLTGLGWLKESDLRDAIQQIQCPRLHLCGTIDPLTPHNPSFPQVRIPQAGHVPLVTHVDVLAKYLEDFFYDSGYSISQTTDSKML